MNFRADFVDKLRNSGLRPTKQRLKICEVLFNTEKTFHFTIKDLSKIINEINQDAIIASNSTYPRSGAFEVTIDRELVFSKLTKNRFPTYEEIKSWVEL